LARRRQARAPARLIAITFRRNRAGSVPAPWADLGFVGWLGRKSQARLIFTQTPILAVEPKNN
jgi:hypothetical protein